MAAVQRYGRVPLGAGEVDQVDDDNDDDDDDDDDDPDPEPEPEPEPVTAEQVLAFAGYPTSDTALVQLVNSHLPIVTAQVWAYTRGRGFTTPTAPATPLAAVIVSACARSAANPTGVESTQLGELRYRPGTFDGWTLPELAILNHYRKRSA